MLIKITESGPEFVEFVDGPKQHYSEATAAGATKKAIVNHVSVVNDLRKIKNKLEKLEVILAEVKKIKREQKGLQQALDILTD